MFSLPDKKQMGDIIKATAYVGCSAILDYVISIAIGTTFGTLTVPINILAVFLKKLITPVGK